MGTLAFTKMHGLGNDFVMLECMHAAPPEEELGPLAVAMCDRHFGVGADGVILVLPSRVASFRMRIFNADGSEAEMCGNGVRAFAKYVYDRRLTDRTDLEIETLAGIVRPQITVHGGKVTAVKVDMGVPRLTRKEIPMLGEPAGGRVVKEKIKVNGERLEVTCVSMGNPHCVTFVDDVAHYPVERVGPIVERHNLFPRRTNVEFVQVVSPSELRMRVWERGAGITIACGTGACASLVAAHLAGRAGRKAVVHLPGGDLKIEWREHDDHVFMTGPATEVFTGEWPTA